MSQVPTRIKRQAHDGVAWLGERQHDRSVGLRAGMGLHIDEVAVEKLLGAVNGELLDFIRWSAALIIALAWIAFGIFVGEDRSLRFQQIGRAHVCTPVTNEHLVFRLLLEKNNKNSQLQHSSHNAVSS